MIGFNPAALAALAITNWRKPGPIRRTASPLFSCSEAPALRDETRGLAEKPGATKASVKVERRGRRTRPATIFMMVVDVCY